MKINYQCCSQDLNFGHAQTVDSKNWSNLVSKLQTFHGVQIAA